MSTPHDCTAENAPKFLDWIRNRGGVAVWQSIDFSTPGRSWSTPARTTEGQPTPKPTWRAGNEPSRVITDPKDITVFWDREVRRFRISLRRGSQEMLVKLTDASTRKVRAAVAKAGKGAYYEFDYDTQEAVIKAPAQQMTLEEWAAKNQP